jgi:hypothetical protein
VSTEPTSRLADADKLRFIARWFDQLDARKNDDENTSDEVQKDLRRIAMNIELGAY